MAFVWDRYNTKTVYSYSTETKRDWAFSFEDSFYGSSSMPSINSSGYFQLSTKANDWTNGGVSRGYYGPSSWNKKVYYASQSAYYSDGKCSNQNGSGYVYSVVESKGKGSINSSVSNASSSAYPQDAISGSYWYTFRGAPSGISYPDKIEAGQAVQITWSAGTNPLYYRVERSTDGGKSWVVLSATVTATSFTDTSIAGDTSSPSVMYRVCTLGEMAVSDYSTGGEVGIPRCSVRIKAGGQWLKGKATYRKENGAWIIIPMADEAAVFGADTHRNVILLSS